MKHQKLESGSRCRIVSKKDGNPIITFNCNGKNVKIIKIPKNILYLFTPLKEYLCKSFKEKANKSE